MKLRSGANVTGNQEPQYPANPSSKSLSTSSSGKIVKRPEKREANTQHTDHGHGHGGPDTYETMDTKATDVKLKDRKKAGQQCLLKSSDDVTERKQLQKLKKPLLIFVVIYILVPTLSRTFPGISSKVVFLNLLNWPFMDYNDFESFGLKSARNFYLPSEENIQLGIWHILPRTLGSDQKLKSDAEFENSLSSGKTIMLYLHGNAYSRAAGHRVELYKVFADMDFHVIAMDYRGYGDSTGHPTEDGMVYDAKHVFKWIKSRSGSSPVYIWGHSLGTGVSTKAVKELGSEGAAPGGLILESPFNNIYDAALSHPTTLPCKLWPAFKWIFVDVIHENGIYFANDKNIVDVTVPIVILHAKDDVIVPFELGEKLYQAADSSRPANAPSVKFVEFDASLGYGHVDIYKAPNLPSIIREFMKK